MRDWPGADGDCRGSARVIILWQSLWAHCSIQYKTTGLFNSVKRYCRLYLLKALECLQLESGLQCCGTLCGCEGCGGHSTQSHMESGKASTEYTKGRSFLPQ